MLFCRSMQEISCTLMQGLLENRFMWSIVTRRCQTEIILNGQKKSMDFINVNIHVSMFQKIIKGWILQISQDGLQIIFHSPMRRLTGSG